MALDGDDFARDLVSVLADPRLSARWRRPSVFDDEERTVEYDDRDADDVIEFSEIDQDSARIYRDSGGETVQRVLEWLIVR